MSNTYLYLNKYKYFPFFCNICNTYIWLSNKNIFHSTAANFYKMKNELRKHYFALHMK